MLGARTLKLLAVHGTRPSPAPKKAKHPARSPPTTPILSTANAHVAFFLLFSFPFLPFLFPSSPCSCSRFSHTRVDRMKAPAIACMQLLGWHGVPSPPKGASSCSSCKGQQPPRPLQSPGTRAEAWPGAHQTHPGLNQTSQTHLRRDGAACQAQ